MTSPRDIILAFANRPRARATPLEAYGDALGWKDTIIFCLGAITGALWIVQFPTGAPVGVFLFGLALLTLEITFPGPARSSMVWPFALSALPAFWVVTFFQFGAAEIGVPTTAIALLELVIGVSVVAIAGSALDIMWRDYRKKAAPAGASPIAESFLVSSALILGIILGIRRVLVFAKEHLQSLELNRLVALGEFLNGNVALSAYGVIRNGAILLIAGYLFVAGVLQTKRPDFPKERIVPKPGQVPLPTFVHGVSKAANWTIAGIATAIDFSARTGVFLGRLLADFIRCVAQVSAHFLRDAIVVTAGVLTKVGLPVVTFLLVGAIVALFGQAVYAVVNEGTGRLAVVAYSILAPAALGAGVALWVGNRDTGMEVLQNSFFLTGLGYIGTSFLISTLAVLNVAEFHLGPFTVLVLAGIVMAVGYAFLFSEEPISVQATQNMEPELRRRPTVSVILTALFCLVFLVLELLTEIPFL